MLDRILQRRISHRRRQRHGVAWLGHASRFIGVSFVVSRLCGKARKLPLGLKCHREEESCCGCLVPLKRHRIL